MNDLILDAAGQSWRRSHDAVGNRHSEFRHPVQSLTGDLGLGWLGGQTPASKAVAHDALVAREG